MTKKYTFYPGCSSQGSAKHLDTSLRAVVTKLDMEFKDIEDWNYCGASVGFIEGGFLPHSALSARNLANARAQGPEDVVTACAACYLNTHGVNEKIREDGKYKDNLNQALGAVGKSYDGSLHVRHACEVLVNDIGLDAIAAKAVNPLTGLKVAGYVGCQTVRPFADTERGGRYDTTDNPKFLDNFTKAVGAEALDFKNKTSCCGGSVSVMSPDKTMHLIKKILEEAQEKGADVISTPCPLCQQNVEMYQDRVNKTFNTNFKIPVVFYSQLMAISFGLDAKKDAALHQNMIAPDKLLAKAKG